jgi:hypothetical protein
MKGRQQQNGHTHSRRLFCAGTKQIKRQEASLNNDAMRDLHAAVWSGRDLCEADLDALLQRARGTPQQLKARLEDVINAPYVCVARDNAAAMMNYRPASLLQRVAASAHLSPQQWAQRLTWLLQRGGDINVHNKYNEGILVFACIRGLCASDMKRDFSAIIPPSSSTSSSLFTPLDSYLVDAIPWLVMRGATVQRVDLGLLGRTPSDIRSVRVQQRRTRQIHTLMAKAERVRDQECLITMARGLSLPSDASGLHCLTSSAIYDPNLAGVLMQFAGFCVNS